MDGLLDDIGVSRAAQRCPECRAEMAEEHVICTKCGFDVERGKQLRTKKYRSSARKLDPNAGAKPPGAGMPVKIALGVVVVAALAVAALMVPKLLAG